MRTRLPNTVHDWERMLKRVYEKQGPSGFAKYQYSISGILQLKKDGISIGTILEYCGDIANPKDVLIEAISGIMLNKDMETTVSVSAGAYFDLMTTTGTGITSNLALAAGDGEFWDLSVVDGKTLRATCVKAIEIPEPATMALLGVGAASVFLGRRRRHG